MSGGVDSSVAAWLLREQGHEVIGVFMRHGQDQPPSLPAPCGTAAGTAATRWSAAHAGGTPAPQGGCAKQGCCTAADAADARRVADMLGLPFYAVNFEHEFAWIVDYFVREYTAGRTPNPCIVCNTWLKFGRLFDYADSIGAEYVATGHYARLVAAEKGNSPHWHGATNSPQEKGEGRREKGEALRAPDSLLPSPFSSPPSLGANTGTVPVFRGVPALCRGRDESKDQSYVLFGIQRRLLARLMFPVGEYRKEEIRRMAERLGLRVAAKRDSQEICFVPEQDHARFIRERCGPLDTAGQIVTTDGTVVGRHDGFERFTVGQRKGLGVALGEPRYVVRIEAGPRRVVLGTQEELARTELCAADANWLVDGMGEGRGEMEEGGGKSEIRNPKSETSDPPSGLRCEVKIRYRSRAAAATVEPLPGDRFRVRFDEPCYGVAPGQAAVCYDGERLLGGGWIE
jgi:tRNA-uridine 2-sulfurtransferase